MKDKFLISGEWEGFYTYDFIINLEKHRMECHFQFNDQIIIGQGCDDVGSFHFNGSYMSDDYTVQMTKIYSTHSVNYKGHADENGIWGKWSIGNCSGGFHLWPKKKEHEKMTNTTIENEVTVPLHSI